MSQYAENNMAVLTNAVALVSAVTKSVVDTDIVSNKIGGEPFNDRSLANFVAARLQAKVAPIAGANGNA